MCYWCRVTYVRNNRGYKLEWHNSQVKIKSETVLLLLIRLFEYIKDIIYSPVTLRDKDYLFHVGSQFESTWVFTLLGFNKNRRDEIGEERRNIKSHHSRLKDRYPDGAGFTTFLKSELWSLNWRLEREVDGEGCIFFLFSIIIKWVRPQYYFIVFYHVFMIINGTLFRLLG